MSTGPNHNPVNRFTQVELERDPEFYGGAFIDEWGKRAPTQFLRDTSRSIVSKNDSPDLPMEATLNPYRGCEHGCSYCYARPTHEYLGFSAGIDFETNILVKEDAPRLLREYLSRPKYQPTTISLSGVTDCWVFHFWRTASGRSFWKTRSTECDVRPTRKAPTSIRSANSG